MTSGGPGYHGEGHRPQGAENCMKMNWTIKKLDRDSSQRTIGSATVVGLQLRILYWLYKMRLMSANIFATSSKYCSFLIRLWGRVPGATSPSKILGKPFNNQKEPNHTLIVIYRFHQAGLQSSDFNFWISKSTHITTDICHKAHNLPISSPPLTSTAGQIKFSIL